MKDIKFTWNAAACDGKWVITYKTKGKTTEGEEIGNRPISENYLHANILAASVDLYEMAKELIDDLEGHTRMDYGNLACTTTSRKVCDWVKFERVRMIVGELDRIKKLTNKE